LHFSREIVVLCEALDVAEVCRRVDVFGFDADFCLFVCQFTRSLQAGAGWEAYGEKFLQILHLRNFIRKIFPLSLLLKLL
jgi:hypothetical protein